MSLSCPVCFKTGFTEFSISTHVEYCILRASRVEAKTTDTSAHVNKKKRLDQNLTPRTTTSDPSLDSACATASQTQRHEAPTSTISSSPKPALSVYQSTTLQDLADLVASAPRRTLKATSRSFFRHQHRQHVLFNHLQSPTPCSQPATVPSTSTSITISSPPSTPPRAHTVPSQLSPALRRAFAAHRLTPPLAASIPDSLFCSSISSDNSLYLAFWEGQERAVSIVYERVLRASLATLTTPPVYCEEPPPGITGEGLLQRRGGYNSWTELDLRAICAKDTPPSQQQQLQHQLPPQQQPPAEPCLPPLSPQHPSSSVEEGLAVCTRDGGGTIRDAMDIDQSNVCPYRLQHQETFHFIRLQTLPPPDDECVEVVRLFGYLERAGERLFGWASLTGRTVEDHDCILAITNMPAWMATHELRDVVAATQQPPQVPPDKPHFTQSKATKPPSTAASTPAILASTNCPLCDSIFPAGMTLSAREAHVNQCLVNMQGDVLSQNS